MFSLIRSLATSLYDGFTLIELIVAVAIMMLLLGTGLISYLQFNDRQSLITVGEDMIGIVRMAQMRARAGDRPAGCDRLEAYYLRAPLQSSSITLLADCENDEVIHSTYELKSGVVTAQSLDMGFRVLHGGVINPGTIALQSPQGLQYEFVVTEGGEVQVGAIVQ